MRVCPPRLPAMCIRGSGLLFPPLLAAGEGVAERLEKTLQAPIDSDAVVALRDVEELRGAVLIVGAKVPVVTVLALIERPRFRSQPALAVRSDARTRLA
jgi:hypothetical protein